MRGHIVAEEISAAEEGAKKGVEVRGHDREV